MTRAWLNGLVTTAVLAATSFHLRTMSTALAGAGPDTSPTSSTAVDTRRMDLTAAPGRLLISKALALSLTERVGVSGHCRAGQHARNQWTDVAIGISSPMKAPFGGQSANGRE